MEQDPSCTACLPAKEEVPWPRTCPPGHQPLDPRAGFSVRQGEALKGDWVLGGSLQASTDRRGGHRAGSQAPGTPSPATPLAVGFTVSLGCGGARAQATVYLVTFLDPPPHSETRLPTPELPWDPSRGREVKAVVRIPRWRLPSSTCDPRGPDPTPSQPHASDPAAPPGTQLPPP